MLLESWELDWGNVGWSFLQIQIAQALLRSWSLNLKCKDFSGDGKSLISGISWSVQFRSGEHQKTTTITFFPPKKAYLWCFGRPSFVFGWLNQQDNFIPLEVNSQMSWQTSKEGPPRCRTKKKNMVRCWDMSTANDGVMIFVYTSTWL